MCTGVMHMQYLSVCRNAAYYHSECKLLSTTTWSNIYSGTSIIIKDKVGPAINREVSSSRGGLKFIHAEISYCVLNMEYPLSEVPLYIDACT